MKRSSPMDSLPSPKKHLYLIFLFVIPFQSNAQAIRLDSCLSWFDQHFPFRQQTALLTKSDAISQSNLNKQWLPQWSLQAQATYQSDVTSIDINIPNLPIPEAIDKDQYKIYAELQQLVFDGGGIRRQKQLLHANALLEQNKVQTEQYKNRGRLLQLFFTALYTQQQIEVLSLSLDELETQTDRLKAMYEAGTATEANYQQLAAENLTVRQKRLELEYSYQKLIGQLGAMTGKPMDRSVQLVLPEMPPVQNTMNRPEYQFTQLLTAQSDHQWKFKKTQRLPKILLFGQAGTGDPALNFLKNGFENYYLGGIRMHWNFSQFYTASNDRQLHQVNQDLASTQRDLFLLNHQQAVLEANEELSRLNALIKTDQELVKLRQNIKDITKIQLEQGLLTPADYVRELNAYERSLIQESLHKIQFIQTSFQLNFIYGN